MLRFRIDPALSIDIRVLLDFRACNPSLYSTCPGVWRRYLDNHEVVGNPFTT